MKARAGDSPTRNTVAGLLRLLATEGMIDRSMLRRCLRISADLLDALLDDLVRRGWLIPAYAAGEGSSPALSCRGCPLARTPPPWRGPTGSAGSAGGAGSAGSTGSPPPGLQRYLLTPAGRRQLESWLEKGN